MDDWNNLAGWQRAIGVIAVSDGTKLVGLPVGTDGKVLTADAAQPAGVKWATPAASGVTTVNGVSGAVVVAGTTGKVTVSTASQTITVTLPTTLDYSAGAFTISLPGTGSIASDALGGITVTAGTGKTVILTDQGNTAQVICDPSGKVTIFANSAVIVNTQHWTNQTVAAAIPGTVVAKLAIYDQTGVLIGYLPIYDAIT